MKRMLFILAAAIGLGTVAPAHAARGGGHGGGFGHGGFHGHGHVFIGGGVFFDPFFPDWYPDPYAYPYPYPYAYAYPYPYPSYAYPLPSEEGPEASAPEKQQGEKGGSAEDADQGTYGLIQLRGVPDDASIDLDGRFWLAGNAIDSRWLALPSGTHTLAARVAGAKPVEQRIEVKPGTTQVVRIGPFPRDAG
jgi:hypothetical protein